jgi:hypothetical protein
VKMFSCGSGSAIKLPFRRRCARVQAHSEAAADAVFSRDAR